MKNQDQTAQRNKRRAVVMVICQKLKSKSNSILCTWNLIIKIVIKSHEYNIALYLYGSLNFSKHFTAILLNIHNKQLCREADIPPPNVGRRKSRQVEALGPRNFHLEPSFLPLQCIGQTLSLGSLKAGEIWIKPFIYVSLHPPLPAG